MNNKAFVNRVEVPDAEANIIPRPVGYWRGRVVFLNSSPPESSDNSCDFLHKGFGE
jgi:hypothetical protein